MPHWERLNFRRARWIAFAGAVLAAWLVSIAIRPTAQQSDGKRGEVVADFALPLLSATGLDPTTLDGPLNHRGKPLLLHFWAPSCAPCRAELPIWRELAQHGTAFTVLTVAGDDSEEVARYLSDHQLLLPVVWDENGTAHRALNVWGIPHTFAISRTGVIVRDLPGAQTRAELAAALEAASAAK